LQKLTTRFIAASWVSFQRPAQRGMIRPTSETWVASVKTSPAPPHRELAQMHQVPVVHLAVTVADVLAHWDTTTRFSRVRLRRVKGLKRWLMSLFRQVILPRLAHFTRTPANRKRPKWT